MVVVVVVVMLVVVGEVCSKEDLDVQSHISGPMHDEGIKLTALSFLPVCCRYLSL